MNGLNNARVLRTVGNPLTEKTAAVLVFPAKTKATPEKKCSAAYAAMTDAELVRECQGGTPGAFDCLIKRSQNYVIARLHRLAPDNNDIADVAQEVFIRSWKSIHQLKNPFAYRKWLNQIIVNMLKDEYRKRPANVHVVSIDEPMMINGIIDENVTHEIKDTAPVPDELIEQRETLKRIGGRIDLLQEPFKTCLVLRDVHDLTYHEIARLTNSELGTVKSRIARARKKLTELLGDMKDLAA